MTVYINGVAQDAFTAEEEWIYKLLCGITSPSLMHMQLGAFNFTPTNNIYSLFKNLIRYAGLAVNYVDWHWTPEIISGITRHTNAEGAITGIGATANLFYVNESDVEAITNARSLWFRRLQWMLSTAPTRIIVDNVAPGGSGTAAISVGANGSIIRNIFSSGYEFDIQFTVAAQVHPMVVNTKTVYRVAANDYDCHWWNGPLYTPLASTIDAQAVTYNLIVYAANPTLNYTGYSIIEKYDLPAWWMTG